MAKKAKLSWFAPRRQWRKRKKVKGQVRTWYLGESGINKTDRAAYDAALTEWEAIEAELEREPERQRLGEVRQRNAGLLAQVAEVRNQAAQNPEAMRGEVFLTALQVAQSDAFDHPDFQLATSTSPGGAATTIAEALDQYLAHFRTLVKVGDRSNARYQPLKIHLEAFRDWAGGGESLHTLNGAVLAKYHSHLLERLGDGTISANYAHDLLGSVKQWVRWCWQSELTETLPRNLDTLNIRVPARKVKTLDTAAVRRVVDAAEGRGRLYVSLALLCGLTAKDIADLRHHEVNLKARTITRQRSKTRHHGGDVPTVTYCLPAPVMKLLKQHATEGKGEDRVLLTESGLPLVHGNRCDAVRLAFDRLVQRVNKQKGKDGKPLPQVKASMKLLRATSADLLEQSEQFKPTVTLWLGHSPRTIKDRHYVNADQKLLDRAVGHLVKVYGLDQAGKPGKPAKKGKDTGAKRSKRTAA